MEPDIIRRTLVRQRVTKNAVLYEELHEGSGVRNVYIRKDLVHMLGDPEIIELTVRPSDE